MTSNVGTIDRIVRLIVGIALIAYGIANSSLLGAVGLVPIVTAGIGWCPAYTPFGLSTCPRR